MEEENILQETLLERNRIVKQQSLCFQEMQQNLISFKAFVLASIGERRLLGCDLKWFLILGTL